METKILSRLEKLLAQAVENCLGGKRKTAIVYSGGIDSSLIAFLAYRSGAQVTSFTAGWPNSPDIQFLSQIQKKIPFRSNLKLIKKTDLRENLPLARKMIKKANLEPNLMQLSLAVGLILVLKEIKRAGFKMALSGQGADELFAGYFRALKLNLKEINLSCQEQLERLRQSDIPREKIIADKFKIKIGYPYLDQPVVKLSLNLEPGLKLKKTCGELGRKYIELPRARRLGDS
jgi:asparagine synthase (glutamine-hydrolysing)